MTTVVRPWEGAETTEKAQRALDRLRETFSVSEIPAGVAELAGSESGVHDLYMNLKRQLDGGKVSKEVKLLIGVAVASAAGSTEGVRFLGAAAREAGASAQAVLDAVSVATVCTIFNGYYHFRDLAPNGEFDAFRAPFNANTLAQTTLTVQQTELICIVVSAWNNCHTCVQGHMAKAQSVGISNDQIDEAIKAGTVARALANVAASLDAEPEAVGAM